MNHRVLVDQFTNGPERLIKLTQEKNRLTLMIELAWQSIQSRENSAVSAELVKHGHISREREAWIRATVLSKDQANLDSLYIDLDGVRKQIDSMNAQIETQAVNPK